MAKKNDKQSMAEDYLAQAEWEASHPLDQRGRPSWKYQPKWKYQRVYPKHHKVPLLLWITMIPMIIVFFGFVLFYNNAEYPGVGILGAIVILSTLVLFYFLTRPSI